MEFLTEIIPLNSIKLNLIAGVIIYNAGGIVLLIFVVSVPILVYT